MNDLADRVAEIVGSIPAGRVMTYGAVAREAGTGARVIGRILHRGGHDIPWWRVVDADGHPYIAAAERARAALIRESTPLLRDGDELQVDLARAAWAPHC